MEKIKLFGIIIGICAILSALLGWWGMIAPGFFYGTGLISNPWLYPLLGATGYSILVVTIFLLVAGVFYLLISFNLFIDSLAFMEKAKFIFLLIGIFGSLALNLMFIILWEVPIFAISGGGYMGLGAGLFLGIAALVIAFLQRAAEAK